VLSISECPTGEQLLIRLATRQSQVLIDRQAGLKGGFAPISLPSF
jgi:hypothetical protein